MGADGHREQPFAPATAPQDSPIDRDVWPPPTPQDPSERTPGRGAPQRTPKGAAGAGAAGGGAGAAPPSSAEPKARLPDWVLKQKKAQEEKKAARAAAEDARDSQPAVVGVGVGGKYRKPAAAAPASKEAKRPVRTAAGKAVQPAAKADKGGKHQRNESKGGGGRDRDEQPVRRGAGAGAGPAKDKKEREKELQEAKDKGELIPGKPRYTDELNRELVEMLERDVLDRNPGVRWQAIAGLEDVRSFLLFVSCSCLIV